MYKSVRKQSFPVVAALLPLKTLHSGTSDRQVEQILATGLNKIKRHHVRLSVDRSTAMQVVQRTGKTVILEIAADKIAAARI